MRFIFKLAVLLGGFAAPLLSAAQGVESDSSLQRLAQTELPDSERVLLLNRLAQHYLQDSTETGIRLANEARVLAERIGDKRQTGLALLNLGNGYLYADFYDQALQYSSEALEILQKHGTEADQAEALATLGWIYYDAESTKEALFFHRQVLEIYRRLGDPEQTAVALNSMGLVYAQSGDYEKALPFFRESLAKSRSIGSPVRRLAVGMNNIGMSECALGRQQQALDILEEGLAIARTLAGNLLIAELLNQKGNVLLQLKRFPEAENCFLEARMFILSSSSNTRKEKLMDNYGFSAELYAGAGDYRQAYLFSQKYSALRQEILSEEKNRKLADKRRWYEAQKHENEIKLLEQENKLKNLQRSALAAGLGLLAIIALLAYTQQRNNRRRERQLADIRQALLQKELEHEALEKATLNQKIAFKNRELTNFALDHSQKNELLRSLDTELTHIAPEVSAATASRLRGLIQQLRQGLEVNREAEEFHLHVETEYKDFFFQLEAQFPGLTQNEKRLCGQVRLGLSIKDMASLNNISVKSIEMARYRLRKRLQLSKEDDLTEFLRKL